jgi:hypothetical protein
MMTLSYICRYMAAILFFGLSGFLASGARAQICGPDVKHSTARAEGKSPLETASPSDKAVVYVLAPTNEAGDKQMKISADRSWIGINRHHTYFVAALEPGTHELCSRIGSGRVSDLVARLKLTVEAGKSYFILQHATVSPFSISSTLTEISGQDAAILLKKCKRIEFAEQR